MLKIIVSGVKHWLKYVKSAENSPSALGNDIWTDNVDEKHISPKNSAILDDSRLPDHDNENDDNDDDENNNSDDHSCRISRNDVDGAGTPYESVNGDVSPKHSNSVGWDSRSEIASSLDSVSPSQFERQQPASKYEFDDGENLTVDEKEKNSENKKTIIDFADDLSDVSDIESNDSFVEDEENVDRPIHAVRSLFS